MESNAQLEDSKSSSEDSRRSEQSNDDDMGTGRSYECVFCKRGFTTAQALGGHMNIHRKDRAKNRPTVSDKDNDDNNYNAALRSSYSYPSPIQSYHHPHYPIAPEVHVSYQAFLPTSGWGFRPPNTHHSDGLFVGNSQHMNPFGEGDWPRSLSLGIGPSHLDDHEKKKTYGSGQEDELDLELRLGYDP